ncbi:MAG: hypothetical protein KKD39_02535 [Candidatus Altiarchaeota archaeon]|nr:hypothetical protein [Candidatus Altiarchaeota archaeon]
MRVYEVLLLVLMCTDVLAIDYPPLNEVWNVSLGGDVIDIKDVDKDGKLDITLGLLREQGSYAYLLDNDGILQWRNKISVIWPENTPGTFVVDDIDENNNTDLVVGAVVEAKSCYGQLSPYATPIFVLERNPSLENNMLKWVNRGYGYPITLDVSDVVGDSKKEVIMGTRQGMVYMLNSDGQVLMRYPTDGTVNSVLASDLNNDGRKEIILGTFQAIELIDRDGARIWRYNIGLPVKKVFAYDLTGNGLKEVLATDENHTLYVLKSEGVSLFNYSLDAIKPPITAGDFDGDGKNEAVIASGDRVYAVAQSGNLVFIHEVGYPVVDLSSASLKGDGVTNMLVLGARKLVNYVINPDFVDDVKADKYLETAQTQYEEKAYDSALKNAVNAREYYMRLNDSVGLYIADKIANESDRYVRANKLLSDAEKYYSVGEYNTSKDNAGEAEKIYISLNDQTMTQKALELANNAADQLDADYFYLRALEYFRAGKYFDGSIYAKKSQEMYEKLNNTEKATLAAKLVENTSLYPKANEAYDKAMRAFEGKEYEKTIEYAGEASTIYEKLGDTSRKKTSDSLSEKAKAELDRLEKVLTGTRYYGLGESKFNQSNFNGCIDDAGKAKEYFLNASETEKTKSTEAMIIRCERGIEGKRYVEKANELYIAGQYEEAIDYASKARQIFRGIDDIDSALSASDLILEIQEEQKRLLAEKATDETDSNLVTIALAVAVILVAAATGYILYTKRKKTKPPEDIEEETPEPETEKTDYLDILEEIAKQKLPGEEPQQETPETEKPPPDPETPYEPENPPQQETPNPPDTEEKPQEPKIEQSETTSEHEKAEKIKKELEEIDKEKIHKKII